MLDVKKLKFYYGQNLILDNINIYINEGEICALFGPNGGGKTTLLKCLINLLKISDGNVLINDHDINSIKREEIAKLVGYVPQNITISFPFTVEEAVLMGRNPYISTFSYGPDKNDKEIVSNILKLTGIFDIKDKLFNELSGGQKQLVILSRALAQSPKLLLLDEPLSNLDFKNQILFWEIIRKLAAEFKISTLVTTHEPNHVLWYCHKVIVLWNKKIICTGEPESILDTNLMNLLYSDICSVKSLDNIKVVIPKQIN